MPSSLRFLVLLLLLAVAAATAACADDGDDALDGPADGAGDASQPADNDADDAEDGRDDAEGADDADDADDAGDGEAAADDDEDVGEDLPDPAEVGANELGYVPVLMYHRLLEGGGGEYDRSPEGYRAELERLFEEGYWPITTSDLVRGEIDVPAGRSPVVLTFDDSTVEQARLDDDGEIASDTAIGILLEVAEEHEVEATGSLYVNAAPFAGQDGVLERLDELGFELGNHTANHVNLAQIPPAEAERELAEGVEVITSRVDAEVATLSLPLGIWPDDREVAYAGEHGGTAYEHEGILLVGADPAPSPHSAEFDPLAIPRIRSQAQETEEPDYGSEFWLDWLAAEDDRRYVSDGDPDRVSFPDDLEVELSDEVQERANPYER